MICLKVHLSSKIEKPIDGLLFILYESYRRHNEHPPVIF